MAHVFVSYVRENTEQVLHLRDALVEAGVQVWLDRDSIGPGSRWKDSIRKAIQGGDFFIACFSKEAEAKNKSYMNEELTLAIDELRQRPASRTWFIPVILSETSVPARSIGGGETLLDLQWVNLRDNWSAGVRRIVSVIKPLPAHFQRLLGALKADDASVRETAARALIDVSLAEAHDVAVIESLSPALHDDSASVMEAATQALLARGQNGVRAILDALTVGSETAVTRLLWELARKVAIDADVAASAADALTTAYSDGNASRCLQIVTVLESLATSYRSEFEMKYGEVVQFEGMLGEYPNDEQRALSALDALVVPLLRLALAAQVNEVQDRARKALAAIGQVEGGSWLSPNIGKNARAALSRISE